MITLQPISIVIPTYNRALLVQRSIKSVLNQTSPDWELIIVDDGSTDDTETQVQQYLGDKVSYVRQENGGSNKARNTGAARAKYDYITFLDSDDELFPDWVSSFQQELKARPDVVSCCTQVIESNRAFVVPMESLGSIFNNVFGKFSNGASYCIRKKLFFDIGSFDELLSSGQHTEMSFRLADRMNSGEVKLVNILRPLVKIHIHDGPRIRTNSESKLKGTMRTLKKHSALMDRDPVMKRNYAKIVTYQAYAKRRFGLALSYFFLYCKYAVIVKLKGLEG